MRNVRNVLAALVLAAVGHAGLGQVSLSVQMNKPQTPVIGLPFSADQSIRIVRHLDNGMTLQSEMEGHVYRSAAGIERYDGTTATDAAHPNPAIMVYILDPVKHTATLLNSRSMTAVVEHIPATATVSVKFFPLPQVRVQNRSIQPEDLTHTDLGKRAQGMMTLVGRRITGTIPIGKIGNDQPLSVTIDVWVDPPLKLIVDEVEKNPLSGERTLELSNIHGEEPDPAVFEIPAGYKVIDRPPLPAGLRLGPPQLATMTPEQLAKQIEYALSESNASVKNSLAYALVQSNERLSDAQTLAEEAVKLEEQEAVDVAAKGDSATSFQQSIVLTSYWDTLGWVYYRQGKLEKAEAYILAAWDLKPNPEYGLHLGSIYEAQLRPRDAAKIYQMCLSVTKSPKWQNELETHLAKLGDSNQSPVPLEIATPLPSLHLHLGPDDPGPLVEILIPHARPPAVTYLSEEPTTAKSLTRAIQSALAQSLPDSGPETILRRARVSCTVGQTPTCTLDFLTPAKGSR